MSANLSLQRVNESGWRRGFTNVLRKENRDWWGTRRWWINLLIWLLLINGVVAAALWPPVSTEPINPDSPTYIPAVEVVLPSGVMAYMVTSGILAVIGAVVMIQGVILDEKKSGTAAWIMSKPTSRTAFIVAKLIANSVGLLVVTLVIQGAVAYLMFVARGSAPQIGNFVAGAALMSLNMLFYITLTLMLGTLFNDRAPVIAIPLGVLFGAQFLMGIAPTLAQFTPWILIYPNGAATGQIMSVIMGLPISNLTPIIATAVWCVVFTIVAIWRFQKEEF